MNFLLIVLVLSGCAVALAWAAGCVFSNVIGVWSRESARATFARGVLPLASATVLAIGFVAPALFVYEPRDTREIPGFTLLVLAAVGWSLAVRTALRVGRMLAATRRVTRHWAAGADSLPLLPGLPTLVIDAPEPVVAVGGVVRPVLYLDRRVLETCSTDELHAIADHELAHVRARDNTKRLLLAATRGTSHRLVTAWREAAEDEADRFAASDERRSLALASALIKVARAGRTTPLQALALSGIHDGSEIDRRVRALLTGVVPPHPRRRPLSGLAIVLAFVLAAPLTWKPVHDALEVVLHALP